MCFLRLNKEEAWDVGCGMWDVSFHIGWRGMDIPTYPSHARLELRKLGIISGGIGIWGQEGE